MDYIQIPLLIILSIAGLIVGFRFASRRMIRKNVNFLNQETFKSEMRKGQLVDIRKKDEFEHKRINGARNFEPLKIPKQLHKLRKDKPIYIYGNSNKDVYRAVSILYSKGFTLINVLDGGLENWKYDLKTK